MHTLYSKLNTDGMVKSWGMKWVDNWGELIQNFGSEASETIW